MKYGVITFSAFLLFGCTSLNNYGVGVRVVSDASIVSECQYIQEVQSSSGWGGFAATGVGYRNAMNELKNTAGEVGGNVILLSTMANTMGGTNMSGSVYKCATFK